MARMRDRLFAGFGAVLFLGSACALTLFVVFQNTGSTTPTPTNAAKTCTTDTQTEEALPAPEPYTTTAPVTNLQTTDLTPGTGPAAKNGDCLVMKYYGTLATTGVKFDENFTTTAGFEFTLGQGAVIAGWDQGLVGMQTGGTRRLVIPASLAYGSQSPSAAIPANSDLVFVVKLIRIQ